MNCPHCQSTQTQKRLRTTGLGYAVFGCTDCGRPFNERTGTPFNSLEVPTDIVFQVLLCRFRYKLSYRDLAAAKAFFAQAQDLAGQAPDRVVSEGHTPYSRAIAEVLGEAVVHERRTCLANPIEQDHRGIKQRYYPLLGFGNFKAAQRFCHGFEEVRQFLRLRQRRGQFVSLAQWRAHVLQRVDKLRSLFAPV